MLPNGTQTEVQHSLDLTRIYLQIALYTFGCIITIIGNVATIYAYYHERGLREKPSDLLVLNLSIADLGIGMFCMPFAISNHICDCWMTKEIGCRIWVVLSDIFVFAGVASVIAISMDRFLLVAREYSTYLRIQNKSRIKITIMLCWSFPIIPLTLDHGLWNYAKKLPNARFVDFTYTCLSPSREIFSVTLIISIIGSFIPLAIIGTLSISFICLLRVRLKKQRQVSITFPSRTANESERGDRQTDRGCSHSRVPRSVSTEIEAIVKRTKVSSTNRYIKPAVTFISLIATMGLCSLPYVSYMFASFVCSHCYSPAMRNRLINLVFFNSFLNPFLYAVTQSKIRKFYWLKIRHCWRSLSE